MLFNLLPPLADDFIAFNLFRYLTFRSGGAVVTALIISFLTGGLGIFQIVALILVAGIGIDYGLFLRNDAENQAFRLASRSVTRCAATTLIAFATMTLSGVTLLQNIGLTVCFGVIAMMAAHLLASPREGQR